MSEPIKFYEFTFGTDDPNIEYVNPDGYAASIALRFDGRSGTQVAEVLISANDDLTKEVVESKFYLNAAQLRKHGQDSLRLADLLEA